MRSLRRVRRVTKTIKFLRVNNQRLIKMTKVRRMMRVWIIII